ncbi:MAG: efflux RND transporter periplasmic adaptor subunit [Armatimonadota bacterium]
MSEKAGDARNGDRRGRGRLWWIAAVAVVVGLIAWSQMRPPEVVVATAEMGDLSVTVTATGDVEGRVAEVSPPVQGQVEAVYADEGDRVDRGELLCRITTGPSVSGSSAAHTAFSTVEAPFSGVVSRRYVDPGDAAVPGQPLYQVADADAIWITALIDDIDVGKVREGQDVEIVLPAYLGESLPGRIERIASTATPRTQTGIGGKVVRTRIELSAGKGPLRPGMEVDVSAESTLARDVLLVPADAVIVDESGRRVLKVVGERVERQEVSLGANNYVHARVIEGLREGDLVVVDGKDTVEPGDQVRTTMRERP